MAEPGVKAKKPVSRAIAAVLSVFLVGRSVRVPKFALLLGCALVFSGCDPADPATVAEAQVRQTLTDPSSAQFRNIEVYYGANPAVCGEINAKNQMGGYVGFKSFYYDAKTGVVIDSDLGEVNAIMDCTNAIKAQLASRR